MRTITATVAIAATATLLLYLQVTVVGTRSFVKRFLQQLLQHRQTAPTLCLHKGRQTDVRGLGVSLGGAACQASCDTGPQGANHRNTEIVFRAAAY